MKHLFETITGGYQASAKVVDGTLILSFPNAQTPVVWRMALGKVKSSAIEVRGGNDTLDGSDDYVLVLRLPDKDVNEIARFDTKLKATRALMAVTQAMSRAHGQLVAPAAVSRTLPVPVVQATRNSSLFGWMSVVLKYGLILIGLATLVYLGSLFVFPPSQKQRLVTQTQQQQLQRPRSTPIPGQTAPSNTAPVGQPMSADDFLRGQR